MKSPPNTSGSPGTSTPSLSASALSGSHAKPPASDSSGSEVFHWPPPAPSPLIEAVRDFAEMHTDAQGLSITLDGLDHLLERTLKARHALAKGDEEEAGRWLKKAAELVRSSRRTLQRGGTPDRDRLARIESLVLAVEQVTTAEERAARERFNLMEELPQEGLVLAVEQVTTTEERAARERFNLMEELPQEGLVLAVEQVTTAEERAARERFNLMEELPQEGDDRP